MEKDIKQLSLEIENLKQETKLKAERLKLEQELKELKEKNKQESKTYKFLRVIGKGFLGFGKIVSSLLSRSGKREK